MEYFTDLLNLLLHFNKQLIFFIHNYGVWTYLLLFLIIFCETGLVITPFLPGDSLLFAAGAFAALGNLNLLWLLSQLIIAAVIGDTFNYWIGHFIGMRAFDGQIPFVKRKYLIRTQDFYECYGSKTIILARFIPVVRTFAPFVAGIGRMSYKRFVLFNIIGGGLWVSIFILGGFFFGSMQIVQKNFSIVVMAIICISILPMIIEMLRNR